MIILTIRLCRLFPCLFLSCLFLCLCSPAMGRTMSSCPCLCLFLSFLFLCLFLWDETSLCLLPCLFLCLCLCLFLCLCRCSRSPAACAAFSSFSILPLLPQGMRCFFDPQLILLRAFLGLHGLLADTHPWLQGGLNRCSQR